MQPIERTTQIHPASLVGTLLTINRDIDPSLLQQQYSNFLQNGSMGFDSQLYDIFKEESHITKLTIFIKYNYELSLIRWTPDKRLWNRSIYKAYEPQSEIQNEIPALNVILGLIKQSNLELKPDIARILIERILFDYKFHLAVYNPESHILKNLKSESEALRIAGPGDVEMYVLKYRELRSNFGNLEDEISQYNETEKKMDEIEIDFLEKAGGVEIIYRELTLEAQKLEWKINFKKLNPDATEKEIEQQLKVAMEKTREELKQIAELEAQTKEAKLHKAYEQSFLKSTYSSSIGSGTRSDNYLRMLKSENRKESKRTIGKALKNILNNYAWFPDTTESQMAEIEKLMEEELERLGKIDKCTSKMSSEYYMLNIEKSKEIGAKIDRILNFSGTPVNPDFVLEGETLAERMDDMEARMRKIDIKIFEWKAKRTNLPKDEEKKRRIGIMQNNGLDTYVTSLKMLISPLKEKVKEMSFTYKAIDADRIIELKRKEFENKYHVKVPVELIDTLHSLTQQFIKDQPLADTIIITLQKACAICVKLKNNEIKVDHLISALAQNNDLNKTDIYKYYLD